MKRIDTKPRKPIPCRMCGELPVFRSVDVYFRKDDTLMTTNIETKCSNPKCDHEHRHFTPKATRREAIAAWNRSNKK
jgi:hypothetical protein